MAESPGAAAEDSWGKVGPFGGRRAAPRRGNGPGGRAGAAGPGGGGGGAGGAGEGRVEREGWRPKVTERAGTGAGGGCLRGPGGRGGSGGLRGRGGCCPGPADASSPLRRPRARWTQPTATMAWTRVGARALGHPRAVAAAACPDTVTAAAGDPAPRPSAPGHAPRVCHLLCETSFQRSSWKTRRKAA